MPVLCYQHLSPQFPKASISMITLTFTYLTGSTGCHLDDCSNAVWDNARTSWGGCRGGEGSSFLFPFFFLLLIYGNIDVMVLFQMFCRWVLLVSVLPEIGWIVSAPVPGDLRLGPFGPWELGARCRLDSLSTCASPPT